MEDATKALLIVIGVFFGLMVISAGMLAYSQITQYYRTEEDGQKIQQIVKFNSEYDSYIRDNVRGSELLSLINKVVDYNKREADVEGIEFERMILIINVNGKEEEFQYSKDDGASIIKSCNNIYNDSDLYKISNAVNNIRNYSGYTEVQLKSLAVNIANIFAPDEYPNTTDPRYLSAIQKRNSVIQDTFGKEYDDITNKDELKRAALEYYQYQQFKRAHFDCVKNEVRYNKNTGRIVRLSFKFNGEFE